MTYLKIVMITLKKRNEIFKLVEFGLLLMNHYRWNLSRSSRLLASSTHCFLISNSQFNVDEACKLRMIYSGWYFLQCFFFFRCHAWIEQSIGTRELINNKSFQTGINISSRASDYSYKINSEKNVVINNLRWWRWKKLNLRKTNWAFIRILLQLFFQIICIIRTWSRIIVCE